MQNQLASTCTNKPARNIHAIFQIHDEKQANAKIHQYVLSFLVHDNFFSKLLTTHDLSTLLCAFSQGYTICMLVTVVFRFRLFTEIPVVSKIGSTLTSIIVQWQNVIHDSAYGAGEILYHDLYQGSAVSRIGGLLSGNNQLSITGLTPSTVTFYVKVTYKTSQGESTFDGPKSTLQTTTCDGKLHMRIHVIILKRRNIG